MSIDQAPDPRSAGRASDHPALTLFRPYR
jgi:hypothetical protein